MIKLLPLAMIAATSAAVAFSAPISQASGDAGAWQLVAYYKGDAGDLNKIMDALMSRDEAQCLIAQSLIVNAKDAIASSTLREEANDQYGTNDIEIDDEPGTSAGVSGTWVAAWVWIEQPDEDEGEGEEG